MLHSVPQLLCRVFSSVERNRSGSLPEKFDGWRCPCRENVRPKDLNCFEVVEVVQGGCRGRARIIFGILQPAPDEPYSGDVHQKSTCVLEGGGGGEGSPWHSLSVRRTLFTEFDRWMGISQRGQPHPAEVLCKYVMTRMTKQHSNLFSRLDHR